MVIVDRQDYIKKMDNILSRQKKLTKVTKVNLKDDILLKFADNREKHVAKVLKKLVESNSMAKKGNS